MKGLPDIFLYNSYLETINVFPDKSSANKLFDI